MAFTTAPFDLGNTLARAAQIDLLRNRNNLLTQQSETLRAQQEQQAGINNALAGGASNNELINQFCTAGVDAASGITDLRTAVAQLDGKELENVVTRGRLANNAARSILASANPTQAALLALKNPELAKIFPNADPASMDPDELISTLEEMQAQTAFFTDPRELSLILANRRIIEGDEFVEQEFDPAQGRFAEISRGPRSVVERQEVGEPGDFSGTTSQKFKKREELRETVVNTSLAIDKATDLVKFAIAEPGAIGTPGAIFSFGNNFLRTADAIFSEILPGEDLSVDFGPEDMDWSSFSGGRLRQLASSNAQFRAGVFSIAFAAAVAEQGSRPSDKDVEGKIKEIAGDSSDVLSFVPTIGNFVRNIDSRVRKTTRVGGFDQSFLNSVLPELDRSMTAFEQAVLTPTKTGVEAIEGFDQLSPEKQERLRRLIGERDGNSR